MCATPFWGSLWTAVCGAVYTRPEPQAGHILNEFWTVLMNWRKFDQQLALSAPLQPGHPRRQRGEGGGGPQGT